LAAGELLLLAMSVFGVSFSVPFEDALKYLGGLIADVLQLELIEAAIRKLLASLAINLPKLGEHWHNVFVLIWLLLGSSARAFGRQLTGIVMPLILIFWAALCALFVAIATGTVPLNSAAMLGWPLAGVVLFFSVLFLLDEPELPSASKWLGVLLFVPIAALAASIRPLPLRSDAFGIELPSVGMLFWVLSVGAFGLFQLAGGLLAGREWHTSARIAIGFDIVGAYGIAIALAAAGRYLM